MFIKLASLSIRSKILISSTITLILISIFIISYYPKQQEKQLLNAMQTKDHARADMLAIGVGIGMEQGNFKAITNAINLAKKDPNLMYILLMDTKGEFFAEYNPNRLDLTMDDLMNINEVDDIIELDGHWIHADMSLIKYGHKDYGILFFGTSLEEMYASINNNLVTTLYISIVIFIIGVGISLFFSRLITKPLVQLQDAASEVARGNNDVQIDVTTSDEIGVLGNAFNNMIRNVHNVMNSLRESEEKYRSIFETAANFITSVNKEGIIVDCNKRVTEILGYTTDEIIGQSMAKIIHPEYIEKAQASLKEILTGGFLYNHEYKMIRKDGRIIEVSINSTALTDRKGNYIRTLCIIEDITQRKNTEKELMKLSTAVSQASNLICITDTNGIVEYVNPHFTRVTGYSLLEMVGKPPNILKSGKHDKKFYQHMWDTIKNGESWTGNIYNKRKNGTYYWERKTITPIFSIEGEIINFLSNGNDITDELLTQQKLIESDKLSAIGTLAAGVAHEFKNYLGGIIGNASFTLEELEDENSMEIVHDTLTKIIEMGEKANEVAMSLLTYSKTCPEERKLEDLKKIIIRSIKLVEKELANLSIEIVTHFDDVPPVEGSGNKIQQLLLNLFINARHAIKSHGVITVGLYLRKNHIEIKVADTGTGIAKDSLDKIFDPFFSTKGVWGKDEVVGTGMGLSICRNIAREHDGDLTVESVLDIGTTFTLTLPIVSGDEKYLKEYFEPTFELKVLIFSLEKSLLSHYYDKACELNAKLIMVDNYYHIPKDLSSVADIVICDSKFTGKLELLKMIKLCEQFNIPYIMVNCSALEYQLSDLYENSQANFKELPNFEKITSLVNLKEIEKNKFTSADVLL